jgi:hypothetical protein
MVKKIIKYVYPPYDNEFSWIEDEVVGVLSYFSTDAFLLSVEGKVGPSSS